MANTRQEAWDLIKEYNKEPFHRQHALTVEGCMRYFAKSLGYGDEEEFWGLVGLLHDLDYEKYPEEHCRVEDKILRKKKAGMKNSSTLSSAMVILAAAMWRRNLRWKRSFMPWTNFLDLLGLRLSCRPSKSVQDMSEIPQEKVQGQAFCCGLQP